MIPQPKTQKRDVWTTMGDCIFARGKTDRFVVVSSTMSECEILTALNGAPAADGMVINPDRYWYGHYQKAQEETAKLEAENAELKRQLADKDGSIKHFLDEIEELQTDTIDLNAKLDEAADRKPVTAQDWDEKKEPATVTPGPIEQSLFDKRHRLTLLTIKSSRCVANMEFVRVQSGEHTVSLESEFRKWDLELAGLIDEIEKLNGDRCGVRKEEE